MSAPPATELRRFWPAVLACFVAALVAWGFGFYGQSVFVAALQQREGWTAGLVSASTTFYYLFSACLLPLVPRAIHRFGPAPVLGIGGCAMAAGAMLMAASSQPWHMFAASLVLGGGWACTSSTAIATTLALWFDRQRGLAISLAFNGASISGFTVAPALVWLLPRHGLPAATQATAAILLAMLLPVLAFGLWRMTPVRAAPDRADAPTTTATALRDPHLWSVALPFAIGLVAQVGFIVHQVAFLLPALGADGAGLALVATAASAVVGRLALGLVIDRANQRSSAAACFALQAAGLALMVALPETTWTLFTGCTAFGLALGNVITLPSLIIQREFPSTSFGLLVGLSTAIGQVAYAFAPALIGIVHDMAGGYRPGVALCAALQVLACVLLLAWPATSTADPTRPAGRLPPG